MCWPAFDAGRAMRSGAGCRRCARPFDALSAAAGLYILAQPFVHHAPEHVHGPARDFR